ncbi:MAG: ribosome maturation factor RimP [Pseudomonadota bacterium]
MLEREHSVITNATALIEPILKEMDFELVDVEYVSNYGRWVLRLFLDKEGGVTIDDCARISSEIGHVIDVKEIIPHEYVLEVSSPGLNRPLKKEKDFIRAVGKKVKISMLNPIKNRRNFTGYLGHFQEDILSLDTGGETVELPMSQIKKANLIYEFDRI